jgi:hypothetical protein
VTHARSVFRDLPQERQTALGSRVEGEAHAGKLAGLSHLRLAYASLALLAEAR